MALRIATVLAVLLTALALVPAGAHLLSLPNKINLPSDQYFVAQSVYRGWAWLGAVLIVAIIADLAAGLIAREHRQRAGSAFAAAILLVLSAMIFFLWTYPTNHATENWTILPDNWRDLRAQWEYSHAVNAAVVFAALCAITIFAIGRRTPRTA
ncbi:MAG: DUF1772 domain-containing protein [Alphaproteobacteria bacterium]|nr:DUF1772 domain-containing protein [Alphaproteobacteria bacterium]